MLELLKSVKSGKREMPKIAPVYRALNKTYGTKFSYDNVRVHVAVCNKELYESIIE
jgi:hypothetical protein